MKDIELTGVIHRQIRTLESLNLLLEKDYAENPYASTCDSIRANSLAIRDLVDTLLNAPASY